MAYLRRFHQNAIIIPGLGEFQDSSAKRCVAYRKGYKGGQPDLILSNLHVHHRGFVIELKTPKGNGTVGDNQREQLSDYAENGYKTLVSNDYDLILKNKKVGVLPIRIV